MIYAPILKILLHRLGLYFQINFYSFSNQYNRYCKQMCGWVLRLSFEASLIQVMRGMGSQQFLTMCNINQLILGMFSWVLLRSPP